ncbi:unnamed protein product [Rangifer tarandus platyrhynchus]|uniref:Uncharacterized protein n=1 Tax=Rangifer tarandus platyrhynchus TaxID=3082113 RepID=A0AC59YUM8_RANTA
MLLEVLSYLPASVLLGQCRHVCWYWRSLVDTRAVWLSILPYSHAKLWPVFRTCLPPDDDDDPRPCLLGRFCERRPLGRNLYPNPRGIDAFLPWRTVNCRSWREEESWEEDRRLAPKDSFWPFYRWCYKKQVLDLEKEGLWPELLDSGKIEICVSAWCFDDQDADCLYRLIVQLLDANQAVLHHFSPLPLPSDRLGNGFFFEVSHVFSNLKKGVRFVSFEHWVRDFELSCEQHGDYPSHLSVTVRVRQALPDHAFHSGSGTID